MDMFAWISQLGGAAFGEYWYLATAVAIPAVAPIVTKLIHAHGSNSAIIRWNKIRKIYRAGFLNTSQTRNRVK